MQHAADHWQRAKDNGLRATDNVQQTADDMQEDASTCEMQQGNTRHCRISCAASSGQRTSSSMCEALYSTNSAQHGTDATHKMQTYDRCRSMQQTHAEPIPRSRQGNARDETNGIRTLAHRASPALESRPCSKDSAPSALCSEVLRAQVFRYGTWRYLRRSSPTLTYIVGMRASLAN